MKKKNNVLVFTLVIFTIMMFFTCKQNVGLGGTIDIERPNGEITYPDAGETPIRGSFVMKGYARDDDGIKSITISFKNIETKETVGPYSVGGFTEGDGSVSWSINIDNESKGVEAPSHELVKKYPIPDGEYTAILTVTDKGGRTYETTKNYKIDNTPPVFIVQRPSATINENAVPSPSDQADGYGAVFSVVGQAGEKNTVEKLNVHVPGATPPIDMTNMFVGNNINAQVAVYTPTDALYSFQAQDATKPIKGALYLYDNAREYKGGNASGEGNKADWYYQWDAIYTDVIAKGYTPEVISDYFAGKQGSDRNDHDKKIKALRTDITALTKLKEKMVKMSEKRSSFKLDPSKSPGFKVIGVKNLPNTSSTPLNVSQSTSMLFKSGNETVFSVELIRNKDNTPLVGGSDLADYNASNIEIVLLKWDGTGDAANCFKTGSNLEEKSLVKFSTLSNTSNITVPGGNLRVKCTFDPSWGEGYYAVKVKGTDTINEESHKFQAYDNSNTASGGFYIINFLTTGSGPRIRPIRPKGVKNTTLDIEADVKGIDSTGVVYYSIDAPVPTSPYPTTVLTKVNPSDPDDLRYKAANVNISGLDDKTHTIYFLVKAGSGSTDSDTTDFTVDKTAPTVTIRYPTADDPQAGDITISGAISDDPPSGLTPEPPTAGVKASSTKYILGKKTSVPTVSTPDYDAATAPHGWKAMDSSTKGSWNVRVNLDQVPPAEYGTAVGAYNEIPLYIFTEDEIGNKDVKELKILFNPDGTKPVVKVLSPQQTTPTTTLGGTIQIFGTASAVIGGPGAVGEVYIQFSRDGHFNNAADGTFGSTNWYNSQNGQPVPGTVTGGADWRISINSDNSFNHTTAQNQDIYFRVRAKNKTTGRLGEWTTPIKIIVDKSAPTIGSPNAVKVDDVSSHSPQGSANARDYTPNMWIGRGKKLIGSLHDDSGIKAVQITSSGLAGGVNHDLAAAQSAGWITPAAGSNYELNIPLDLDTLSQSAKDAGEFSVTISITENTVTPALSTQQTFTFRFDTTDPIGDYGTDKYMNIGNFTSSSITEAQLAQKVRDLGGTASSGGGCKMVAGNSVLTVTKVTGNTVEFTASPALTDGNYSYILYKPDLLIYEGSGGDWIINGVANDSGSGVKEVKAKVVVNGTSSPEITMTETDPQNRITKQLGGTVTWQGKIDLAPTPPVTDGKGKLYYTITDNSGNTYSHSVDVHVKNKPIMVSAVTLSTDIGGTPSSFTGGLSGALNVNRDFIGSVTSTKFAFKNKDNSKIKVEFTGGQGTVKYRLKKGDDTTELQPLTTITSGSEIDLKNHLTAIGNSNGTPTEIILELWDEAHGFAVGTDTAFAKITIKTLFDALDTKSPTVVVQPFHWNKEDDNSLYQNSRANGHVEIDTSSVSGKVTLRGFAYDNVKIDSIRAVLPFSPELTVTATRSGSTFNSTETMASNGAELKVTRLGADYLGYYVKWELSFDSSKIPMGTAKDIKVIANDGGRNSVESGAPISMTFETVTRGAENSASHSSFTSANIGQFVLFETEQKRYLTRISSKNGNTITLDNSVPTDMDRAAVYDYSANKTKTTVKSVPYITSLARESKYNTNRSTSGAYNLLRGDKFTVTGFNLGGTGATVKAIIPDGTTNGSAIPISSGAFTLPATAKSGKIKITVKPSGSATAVEAINNDSNNSKLYNRQDIENRPETQYWTDDLIIDVWKDDEQFTGSNNPKYPSMAMGSNGDLYAAYSNYSESKIYYSKLGGAPQSVYYGYDPPEEAAISVKDSGTVNILYSANYHGGLATSWGASIYGAGGLYCYDTNAPELSFYNEQGGKIYRFELFYHQKQLQQFKNFRIARKDNNIHIAYYDTLAASVKYSTVQSGTTNTDINFIGGPYDPSPSGNNRSEIAWVDLDGSTLADVLNDPNLKRVGTVAKLVDGAAGQFENGLQRTGGTTEYCAIALDGSNRPVVVYADVDKGTLRLARANAAEPKTAAHWKVQKVLPAGDANTGRATDYFAAQFDSAGYLHIVFRNTKGQICYVKSTNANAGASAYTFEKSVVIAENGSRVELTMDGTSPYVAYLSKTNAYDGIQIAYYDAGLVKTWKPDGSADQTGAWNIMTAAMKQRAGDARACIAVAPSSVTDWKAAVGYTPGSVYRVVKYIGR